MSSVASSLMTSDHVIHRDHADELVLFVDDRHRKEVVGREPARHFFLVGIPRRALIKSAVMIRLSGVSGATSRSRRSETTPTRCRRSSTDVEVEHHLDVAVGLQLGDRLADGHVLAQREDMRVHDAAGRLLVVLEQVLDHARFLRAHQVSTEADNSSGR